MFLDPMPLAFLTRAEAGSAGRESAAVGGAR